MAASPFRRFMKLRHRLDALSRACDRAGVEAFPVGSVVWYRHGSNWRSGIVLEHFYGRVKLQTPHDKIVIQEASAVQPEGGA